MTLALYFARRFAIVAGSVIAGLGALVVLFETIEHLRIYSASGIGLRGALALAALAMPMQLYALLPLATMLGAVALFVALARSSELIARRAAGRSALRALAGPAAAALVLGLVATSIANPLAVASAEAHDRRIDALLGRAPAEVGSIGREGLWLRQATETGQMVIRAGGVNADGSILSWQRLDGRGGPRLWRVRQLDQAVSLRLVPSQRGLVLRELASGTVLNNLGCSTADQSWCQVELPGGGGRGYVPLRDLESEPSAPLR